LRKETRFFWPISLFFGMWEMSDGEDD